MNSRSSKINNAGPQNGAVISSGIISISFIGLFIFPPPVDCTGSLRL